MQLKEELEQRGFLYQVSNDSVFDLYEKGGQNFYCGYDPSADSLTIGHLVSLMNQVQYMKRGNKFYLLLGGATGMIGDPSGKDAERNFLDKEILAKNMDGIYKQVQGLMKNLEKKSGKKLAFELVNNADFYEGMSFLDFLREVGKYITVNTMMNKETVKKRIIDPDKSISYTEFSYMLLQGYDFVHLFQKENVKLQTCGSDQRGNCVTGLELIDKKLQGTAYVVSNILLTDSTGRKFGKSEGNAIRLDPKRNSPYFVYQYFLNTNDSDLPKYLKILTLLEFNEINEIIKKHEEKPEARYGQTELAKYIVEVVFSEEAAAQAEKISQIMFSSGDKKEIIKTLNDEDKQALCKELGGVEIFKKDIQTSRLLDLLTSTGLTTSNGEAKKLIQSGGVFCNENKVEDINQTLTESDFTNGICLLRKGKKNYKVIILQ